MNGVLFINLVYLSSKKNMKWLTEAACNATWFFTKIKEECQVENKAKVGKRVPAWRGWNAEMHSDFLLAYVHCRFASKFP